MPWVLSNCCWHRTGRGSRINAGSSITVRSLGWGSQEVTWQLHQSHCRTLISGGQGDRQLGILGKDRQAYQKYPQESVQEPLLFPVTDEKAQNKEDQPQHEASDATQHLALSRFRLCSPLHYGRALEAGVLHVAGVDISLLGSHF